MLPLATQGQTARAPEPEEAACTGGVLSCEVAMYLCNSWVCLYVNVEVYTQICNRTRHAQTYQC